MSLWICANEKPSASQFYFFSKSFYEEVDLTPFLVVGENKLVAKVLYLVEGDFISVYRRSKPAMWFDGALTDNGSTTEISTDESWICEREDGISFHHCSGLHPSMPSFETVHGASNRTPVTVKAMYAPLLDNKCFNPFGLSDQYILTPRPIPQMELFPAREMSIVRRRAGFIEFDAGSYTTVPTPHGNIAVEWQKKDGALALRVSLPTPDMRATVVMPDGQCVEMEGDKATFSCSI